MFASINAIRLDQEIQNALNIQFFQACGQAATPIRKHKFISTIVEAETLYRKGHLFRTQTLQTSFLKKHVSKNLALTCSEPDVGFEGSFSTFEDLEAAIVQRVDSHLRTCFLQYFQQVTPDSLECFSDASAAFYRMLYYDSRLLLTRAIMENLFPEHRGYHSCLARHLEQGRIVLAVYSPRGTIPFKGNEEHLEFQGQDWSALTAAQKLSELSKCRVFLY